MDIWTSTQDLFLLCSSWSFPSSFFTPCNVTGNLYLYITYILGRLCVKRPGANGAAYSRWCWRDALRPCGQRDSLILAAHQAYLYYWVLSGYTTPEASYLLRRHWDLLDNITTEVRQSHTSGPPGLFIILGFVKLYDAWGKLSTETPLELIGRYNNGSQPVSY